jgi:hypothetical protein
VHEETALVKISNLNQGQIRQAPMFSRGMTISQHFRCFLVWVYVGEITSFYKLI